MSPQVKTVDETNRQPLKKGDYYDFSKSINLASSLKNMDLSSHRSFDFEEGLPGQRQAVLSLLREFRTKEGRPEEEEAALKKLRDLFRSKKEPEGRKQLDSLQEMAFRMKIVLRRYLEQVKKQFLENDSGSRLQKVSLLIKGLGKLLQDQRITNQK